MRLRRGLLLCVASYAGVAQRQHLSGIVEAGKPYTHDLGRGLVLRVTVDSIEVQPAPAKPEGENYAACVTGPPHGPGPLQVEAWHFDPAQQDSSPGLRRELQFALNAVDNTAECEEVRRVVAQEPGGESYRPHPWGRGLVVLSAVRLTHSVAGKDAEVVSFRFVADITLPRVRKR